MESKKRKNSCSELQSAAKRRKINLSTSRLQLRSLDYETPSSALARISFIDPEGTKTRKHRTVKFEVCGEMWWIWIYINTPDLKRKRPRRGYVSCYLELVEGKYKSPNFWAQVKFEVRVKHKTRISQEDITKKSTMVIANYDASRGFRRLIRWDDLKDFTHDNKKLYIDIFMDVQTSEICDDIKSISPATCSSIAFKLEKHWTEKEINRIIELKEIACDRFGAKPTRRDFGSDSKKYGDTSGHSVTYIQDALIKIAPRLRDKIYKTVRDNITKWTHRPESYITKIKRIEFIKYKAPAKPGKEGDWVGWHTDTDVTLVMGIMLSSSDEYTGGIYQAKMPEVTDFPLEKGDCILFPGHILEHRVVPVKSGCRKILIIEFWKSEHTQSIKRSYEAWDSSSSDSS